MNKTSWADMLNRKPDLVITEEQAIEEGVIVDMDCWGIATFRGEPVATVSSTLFSALQQAFGLAATAGITTIDIDWEAEIAELDNPEYRDWVDMQFDSQDGLNGIIELVPPWSVLGELLQVFITDAADTAVPGETSDYLYATPPLKALMDKAIWLQRPAAGRWTAFFPEDY